MGLITVVFLVIFLLAVCSGGNSTDGNQNLQETADTVTTSSIVAEEAFKEVISSDGEWIIATVNDLTFDKEIVVE